MLHQALHEETHTDEKYGRFMNRNYAEYHVAANADIHDIDELHVSVFEKVLGDSWKGEATATVDATLASRYHERFADHAVAVAKKYVYLSTGDWAVAEDDIALAVEQQQELGHA